MVGRDFLESAKLMLTTQSKANRRSVAGRAFVAYLNELLAALARWGYPKPPGVDPVAFVQNCLRRTLVMDATRLEVGADDLRNRTLEADFDLSPLAKFQTPQHSNDNYYLGSTLIDLIKQIEADSSRLAAVIAVIQANSP